MEEKQSVQHTVLEQLDIHMQKSESKYTPSQKLTQKCIIDLNVKCKTIKPAEDNIGEDLGDLGYGDDTTKNMIHERNN